MNYIKLEEIDLEKLDTLLYNLINMNCPIKYELENSESCIKDNDGNCEKCWKLAIAKEVTE